jgi:hypothetical protein
MKDVNLQTQEFHKTQIKVKSKSSLSTREYEEKWQLKES